MYTLSLELDTKDGMVVGGERCDNRKYGVKYEKSFKK